MLALLVADISLSSSARTNSNGIAFKILWSDIRQSAIFAAVLGPLLPNQSTP